jgi:hypothetical protein
VNDKNGPPDSYEFLAGRLEWLIAGDDGALDRRAAVRRDDLGLQRAGRRNGRHRCEQACFHELKHVKLPITMGAA